MNATPEADAVDPLPVRLARASRLLTWGLPLLGLIHAARRGLEAADHPALAVLDVIYLIGAYALAGFGLGLMVQALGDWVGRRPHAGVTPRQAVSKPASPPHALAALDLPQERTLGDIRQAIRASRWDEARDLIDAFEADNLDDPQVAVLHRELLSARDAVRDDHMAQLDAARKVNDPDRVLELHQFLAPLLEAEARSSLDAELSQWFLRLIHNRLRSSKIQADLALLAGRIAEAFSHTVEGASLRASLPTLRRSAGLCPRCAQPYTGVADACPACMGQGQPPVPPVG